MKTIAGLIVLAAAAATAHADAVLEYEGGDAACHGDFARLVVQDLSLRVDSAPPSQDTSFIYDAAEKMGIALDRQRRQFFEMEFDDDAIDFESDVMKSTSTMVNKKIDRTQAQVAANAANCTPGRDRGCPQMPPGGAAGMQAMDPKMMEQMMQQSAQNLPPEQRKQMQQAMDTMRKSGYFGAQAEPVVETTGEQRTIGGITCSVERVSVDGQLEREDCRAPIDALGLDAADVKRLQRAIQRMQKWSSAITQNLNFKFAPAMHRDKTDPQHLLVARRCFEQGRPAGTTSLRVGHASAPADWFAPPAGYTKMDMGMRER